jgi:hypothetical protein
MRSDAGFTAGFPSMVMQSVIRRGGLRFCRGFRRLGYQVGRRLRGLQHQILAAGQLAHVRQAELG